MTLNSPFPFHLVTDFVLLPTGLLRPFTNIGLSKANIWPFWLSPLRDAVIVFSTLTLLVGHQEEHPVSKKNWVVRCWYDHLSGLRCKWFEHGAADAIISCFIKIQTGLTFQVQAYPGCPGKEAVKWASVWSMSVTQCSSEQPQSWHQIHTTRCKPGIQQVQACTR